MGKEKVVAYGEFLVKHTVSDLDNTKSLSSNYRVNKEKYKLINSFGGTEADFLICLSALGIETRYASALGNNELSKEALEIVKENKVNTKYINTKKGKIGEYYFLKDSTLTRDKATKYYRKGSAINNWDIKNFDFDGFFSEVKFFHVTGISFSLDNGKDGTAYKNGIRFLKEASKRNIDISFDINYRPAIWIEKYKNKEKALLEFKKCILPLLQYVNVLFVSDKDLKCFFGFDEKMLDGTNASLLKIKKEFNKKYPNIKLLVIRNRNKNTKEYNSVQSSIIAKDKIIVGNKLVFPIIEQIGGGDVFAAGIIYGLIKYGYNNYEEILDGATKLFVEKHQIKGDYIKEKNMKSIENKIKKNKEKINILITVDDLYDQAFLDMKNNLSKYANVDIKNQNTKSLAGYDIYVAKQLSKSLLKTADKLKVIFAYKTGVEKFPLEELKERKINLYNSHCNAPLIAQYAISLLLSLTSRITEFDKKMRKGVWYDEANPYWNSIETMKVGILGYGSIGKQINIILRKLDVSTYTIKRNKHTYKDIQTVSSFDDLIDSCDVIISALPSTKETKNIFNKKVFKKMKNKYLINVGRSNIINEKDLYEALNNKYLAGAAIDTWNNKPKVGSKTKMYPSTKAPFEKLDNIILSPHQAMKTKDGHISYIEDTQINIINYLLGNKVNNKVDLTKGY